MVRKWSYLNSADTNPSALIQHTLLQVKHLYNFKVFRKTTRFKRFNKGITFMVRKNYARRKHQTNWLVLSYITKNWVHNYLSCRQFERFYTTQGYFNTSTFSTNVTVFNQKLQSIKNLNGISISSCSRPILNRYLNSYSKSHFLNTFIKNANSSSIQTTTLQDLNDSFEVFPSLTNFENQLASSHELLELNSLDSISLTYELLFKHVNLKNTLLYQIQIQLTLFNSNRLTT